MKRVRAKKHLGQHFLKNKKIAEDTVEAFGRHKAIKYALEVGPGMGVLTEELIKRDDFQTIAIDIDEESVDYLRIAKFLPDEQIIQADFLKMDFQKMYGDDPIGIIGNFPYNISTQILFKAYDSKDQVLELVGMFQKEVAERVVSPPGSKVYGITSVLIQAFYDVEYLFTVEPTEFDPPPKVQSAVIRLSRNDTTKLACDHKLFKQVVKAAFNQRRKTLRNGLKAFLNRVEGMSEDKIFDKRAEQLSVAEFVKICLQLEGNLH